MPEDAKGNKAKKLAAARKKLKEYQTKEKRGNDSNEGNSSAIENLPSGATSATLSEKSDSELNLNGNALECGVGADMTIIGEQLIEIPSASPMTNREVDLIERANEAYVVNLGATQPVADDIPLAASYFNSLSNTASSLTPAQSLPQLLHENSNNSGGPQEFSSTTQAQHSPPIQAQNNLNAIQLLITEKSQLNSELNKYRSACRERDLEIEELRTEFSATQRRFDELQNYFAAQQQSFEETRSSKISLQEQLADSEAKREDQASHLAELKLQFNAAQQRLQSLEQQYKEKCNELELSQIRINQLSDESCISKDDRVETLTQTQFMYEQQIRDLQAMVQQLTHDKELANTQYQNYVQHLNTEVTNLSERNSELTVENSKLQEHEQQLIQHISELEREIQRNITRQDQLKADEKKKGSSSGDTKNELEEEIAKLKEIISDFDFERHEFQLKIKSQEDRLDNNERVLQEKIQSIAILEEQLQNVNSEQPDKTKLLATMESDKIAASRALSQNFELKKQLDELELRFVQLTNDKAELMNKLDAEEYTNREMRSAYSKMEETLHNIDERFKFKDEEMIRLSHENMDLTSKISNLQKQLDQLKQHEILEKSERFGSEEELNPFLKHKDDHENHDDHAHYDHGHHDHDHNHHDHDHDHQDHDHNHHDHDQDHHDHDHHKHDHNDHDNHSHKNDCASHDHENTHLHHDHSGSDHCQEVKEGQSYGRDRHDHSDTKIRTLNKHSHHPKRSTTPQLASNDAVQKLQERFTQLMSQLADLTEDKQRLEHLVLQLQSETETIGEYITLYQTQRRILKQREYEKAAQMQLLQAEREKMQERISVLNNLVASLGAEMPHNKRLAEHLNSALAESVSIEPANELQQQKLKNDTHQEENAINQKLNIAESQEILTKIQSIITEIKENTKEIPIVSQLHEVDHLNCCLGKFEVV